MPSNKTHILFWEDRMKEKKIFCPESYLSQHRLTMVSQPQASPILQWLGEGQIPGCQGRVSEHEELTLPLLHVARSLTQSLAATPVSIFLHRNWFPCLRCAPPLRIANFHYKGMCSIQVNTVCGLVTIMFISHFAIQLSMQ